jgi:hypothetical protein
MSEMDEFGHYRDDDQIIKYTYMQWKEKNGSS